MGAKNPEDFGEYYAWGEIDNKKFYDWSNYIHCDGSEDTCHDIGINIAGTEYDVAYVKWGDIWMMPSFDQLIELMNESESIWTTLNGVDGQKFIGSNGGSIFLPAAAFRWGYGVGVPNYGMYWSSSKDPSYSNLAHYMTFPGVPSNEYFTLRYYGLSVRPVSK